MGLKNANSTVNDLKATFFDVFCEHTEELAALIEVLANDPTADAMKIESLIFQRIIMLNKTADNIKGLMFNVDELNLVKGAGLKNKKSNNVVSGDIGKSVSENVGVKDNLTITPPQVSTTTSNNSEVVNSAPQQVPTTAPQQVPTTAPQVMPTTSPQVISTTVPQIAPPPTSGVIPTTAPKKSFTQMLTGKSTAEPVQNRKLSFIKNG